MTQNLNHIQDLAKRRLQHLCRKYHIRKVYTFLGDDNSDATLYCEMRKDDPNRFIFLEKAKRELVDHIEVFVTIYESKKELEGLEVYLVFKDGIWFDSLR